MSYRPRLAGRSRRTLIVLLLASITALTLDARGSSLVDGARSTFSDALRPATSAAGKAFHPVENVWNGVFRYGDVKKQNDQLRAEVAALQGRESLLDAKEAQWKSYYALNNLSWAPSLPAVTANIIGARPSNFDQTVQIDRGSSDGVVIGYPVVTGAGLVGRVVRVSDHAASVRLVTDPLFTAGVAVGDDATALIRGEGIGQQLTVELAQKPPKDGEGKPTASTVEKGTVVLTSGQDVSLFPKDIPVGVVDSVDSPPQSGNLSMLVSPAADLDHLSIVKVLKWDPPRVRP